MYKQLEIDKLVREDLIRCQELYDELQLLFKRLPEGSLIDREGHTYHVYRENGRQIKKVLKDSVLINKLKMRQFLKKGLPVLEDRISACKAFLKKSKVYDPIGFLQEMPFVYRDVNHDNLFLKGDIDPDTWKQEMFKRNSIPFDTDHHTESGVPVRSKAEAMIGTQMENRKWAFICEPRMWFGRKMKTPDFAILHPVTRKIIYLEHFGKMGEYDYVVDTMDKLILYRQYGLHLGVNFFFTWESKQKPLTYSEINSVLDEIEAAGMI